MMMAGEVGRSEGNELFFITVLSGFQEEKKQRMKKKKCLLHFVEKFFPQ